MSENVGLNTTSSGQDVSLWMKKQRDETTEAKPGDGDYIEPSGPVSLSQVPITVESRARRGRSYDAPAQLSAGVGKLQGSFPTYLKPSGVVGTPPEVGPLLESLMGKEEITANTRVRYTLRSPDDAKVFYTLWRLLGTTLRRAIGAYVAACTFRIGATRDQEGFAQADWTIGGYSLLKAPTDSNTAAVNVPAAWASGQSYAQYAQVEDSGTYYYANTAHSSLTGNVEDGAPSQANAANWTEGLRVPVNQVSEFAVGQYLTLGTEDNSDDGFEVTALDADNSVIILSGTLTANVPDGTLVQPWTPASARVGEELGGRLGTTDWGAEFTGLKIISLEIPVNLQVADIPGQQGDGEYVRGLEYGQRQITWSLTVLHRPDYEAIQSHILSRTKNDLVATVGNTPGERVRFTLKNAQILGAEEVDGTPMQMRFNGTAEASSAGNDVLQIDFD